MTDRELRLRLRIDRLQDERDEALRRVNVLSDQLNHTRKRLSGQTNSARVWKRKYDELKNMRSRAVPVLILSSRYPRVKK